MNKTQYRIQNTEKYALIAFQDLKNKSWENSIKNARVSVEAICKAVILKKRGETQGEEILLGERSGLNFQIDNTNKKPDLNALINICKRHKYFSNNQHENEKIYHRFDDIRKGGNKGSHDPLSQNDEVTEEEVELCISIFKEILRWFYDNFLNHPIPQILKNAFIGNINSSIVDEYKNSVWDAFYQACDGFSKNQRFVLIAPPEIPELTDSQIALLSRINWHLIFDFNPKSKEEGLFKCLKGELANKQFHPITIEQKGVNDLISNSTLALNYIFANGINSLKETVSKNPREWKRKKYIEFTNSLVKEYVRSKIQHITIISLYDDIKYTREIIEAFDVNIANSDLLKIILLVQDKNSFSRIKEEFEDYSCDILELTCSRLVEGVGKTVISTNQSHNKKLFQIPSKNPEGEDLLIDVTNKYLSFLERNIEILFNGIAEQEEDINPDIFSFFKGNPVSWNELANDVPVRRDKIEDLFNIVDNNLKKTKRGYVIELYHRPGSGGSTLARNIAFRFHTKYPTILVKKYHKHKTSEALFDLATITQKPILAVFESYQVSQNDFNRLVRQINEDKKYVVCIYVKRTFSELKTNSDSVFLSERMVSIEERNRFITKFLQIADKGNHESIRKFESRNPAQCDIIDFPLTAFEKDYKTGSLDKYILYYLNKLPSSQLKFAGFSSLLYYYTQKSISELWLCEIFPLKSLSNELSLKPNYERYFEKLFLNEIDIDFQETEFWNPKYNRFATEILQLSVVGLNIEKKSNWKDYLHTWIIDFIRELKNCNEYLTDDVRGILKSLILERDHEDLLGSDESYETTSSNRKFSRLLKDVSGKEKQIQVFNELIKAYPDEAHFRGHFGRFLYEKANDEPEFEKAEEQINIALNLGENDYNLWHLKGMCNRRRIEYLLRSNIEEYTKEEIDDFEIIIQELTNEANEAFLKSRELNPYNLYSHTAQIQTLIRVIEFGRRISRQSKEAFIVDKNNIWYEEQLDVIFNLLDQAQYNIELSKDLERSRKLSQSKEMIDGCEGVVFRLMGDFSSAIDKFKQLSESTDRAIRPYYRKMYVYATLAQKVNNDPKRFYQAWGQLSQYEFESLKGALENNIREQPENPYHIKLWLQAVRFSKIYMSLEDCISIANTWVDNSAGNEISNIEAIFYLYVLYACKAISEGDSFSQLTINQAEKFLRESSKVAKNDRYSFEWFGSGSGVKRLVNHRQLSGMNSKNRFFDDDKVQLLERVEGTVTNIYSRQSGKIKLMCGLECFFVPFHAGLEEGVDETAKVSFYVGFRQTGLTAWEVKTVETQHPQQQLELELEIEPSEFTLEGDEEINEIVVDDIPEEKDIDQETLYSHTTKLQGLTIKGKVDLSQFEKYKKKSLKTGNK